MSYEVNRRSVERGAILSHDMQSDISVAKLQWILGHTDDPESVRKLMYWSFEHEINPYILPQNDRVNSDEIARIFEREIFPRYPAIERRRLPYSPISLRRYSK